MTNQNRGPAGGGRRAHTAGGRVNAHDLAKIDAGARIAGLTRSEFVIRAAIERSEGILRDALGHSSEPSVSHG